MARDQPRDRDLRRRVDMDLDGLDRLLTAFETDVVGGGRGPPHDWDGRPAAERALLLADRLCAIADELDRDDRFPGDADGYESPIPLLDDR